GRVWSRGVAVVVHAGQPSNTPCVMHPRPIAPGHVRDLPPGGAIAIAVETSITGVGNSNPATTRVGDLSQANQTVLAHGMITARLLVFERGSSPVWIVHVRGRVVIDPVTAGRGLVALGRIRVPIHVHPAAIFEVEIGIVISYAVVPSQFHPL